MLREQLCQLPDQMNQQIIYIVGKQILNFTQTAPWPVFFYLTYDEGSVVVVHAVIYSGGVSVDVFWSNFSIFLNSNVTIG